MSLTLTAKRPKPRIPRAEVLALEPPPVPCRPFRPTVDLMDVIRAKAAKKVAGQVSKDNSHNALTQRQNSISELICDEILKAPVNRS